MMKEIQRSVIECVLVGVVGLIVGLGANAVYSDGLSLGRDYFRSRSPGRGKNENVQKNTSTQPAPVPGAAGGTGTPDPAGPVDHVLARLEEIGLNTISHEEVAALFKDPNYENGAVVLVDARDDEHYSDGHIPGALQLFPFRVERYIDEVLPYCQGAEKIVVYCGGGDCEDSQNAALVLRDDYGIDPSGLWVYVGGMKDWNDHKLPVELGERFSRNIVEGGSE